MSLSEGDENINQSYENNEEVGNAIIIMSSEDVKKLLTGINDNHIKLTESLMEQIKINNEAMIDSFTKCMIEDLKLSTTQSNSTSQN